MTSMVYVHEQRGTDWMNALGCDATLYFDQKLVKALGGGDLLNLVRGLAFSWGGPARLEYDRELLRGYDRDFREGVESLAGEDFFRGWKIGPDRSGFGLFSVVKFRHRRFWHWTRTWRIHPLVMYGYRALLADGHWVELRGRWTSPVPDAVWDRNEVKVRDRLGEGYWVPTRQIVRVEAKRTSDIVTGKVEWDR